jgi:hypothetical protein
MDTKKAINLILLYYSILKNLAEQNNSKKVGEKYTTEDLIHSTIP